MDPRFKPLRIRDEKGQTATEFAIVLPVLALLLFGVIQFGILFNNYITLTDAVRAGDRKAAVSRQSGTAVSDTEAAVRKAADTLDRNKLTISVSPGPPWAHGSEVVVEAQYPYEINLLGLVLASGQLKSTTVERVE